MLRTVSGAPISAMLPKMVSARVISQMRQRVEPTHGKSNARLVGFVRRRYYSATSQTPLGTHHDAPSPASSSLVLYDSLDESFKSVPTRTASNKGVAWYTCGPTTYAPAHLGHARTYVCLDIVRRFMEHNSKGLGPPPLFVMNITNVDDKILAAAAEAGEPPIEFAKKYEDEFWEDWDSLNCLRPHVVTRVTDHVETDLIPYIEKLVQSEMAYTMEGGGVYFDVRAYESKLGHLTKYGKLAPPTAATDFFSTHNIHDEIKLTESKKRDLRDFVLWKNRKEGESLFWPSPWGEGRPGWHIECSAMIESVRKQFEETHEFYIHAGGVDLKFPHHTNEIAQAEAFHFPHETYAANKKEWIPHWVHTGHLHISGLKMSKSLKNFVTVQEMLSRGSSTTLSSPSDDFRLWCLGLSGSYRGPATYSTDRLDEAKVLREKIVRFLLDAQEWIRHAEAHNAPKKWMDKDYTLFKYVLQASDTCKAAMTGRASGKSEAGSDFDFDGSTYVKALVALAEAGSTHVKLSSMTNDTPVEPVQFTVKHLRDLLSLAGFSNATVQVGVDLSLNTDQSQVLGGERALLDQLVNFRSSVRKAVLSDVRNKKGTDTMHEILNACDSLRDEVFPPMGVQILDDAAQSDSTRTGVGWKFCVPRTEAPGPAASETLDELSEVSPLSPTTNIDVKDLFRFGQYEGAFSNFDDQGIPTHNADGSEVSKRLLKKLGKKRDKFLKRDKK